MKKKSPWYVIHVVIIMATLIIGVPLFLLNYNVMSNALQSLVKMKTDPSFSGGKVAVVFHDPVGDDYGFGELPYPEDNIHPGSLDLVRYTVHQPVRFSRGPGWRSFWQLDFSFRSPGKGRNIKVYFGEVDSEIGSNVTRTEFAENIEFSPHSPWQFVISIKDDAGTIESWDRSFSRDLKVFQSQSGTDVFARISLADSELQFLKTLPECYHFVLIGALDSEGRDGFADMADSDFVPKVYDILVPDGTSQEDMLSAWDEDAFVIPVLQPVLVRLANQLKDKKLGKAVSEETLSTLHELENAAAEEAAIMEKDALARYALKPADSLEYAIAAFEANKLAEAEVLFEAVLAVDTNSIPAMAYTGSLIALRAADAPPLIAVGIVKDAYVWLDRAVEGAVTDEDKCFSYLNRGNVSLAVPNTVFGMAAQGGEDFLKAAESIRRLSREDLVGAVTNAARCFEIANETNKAESWYREARRLLRNISDDSCAQQQLDVFRYFEVGSLKPLKAVEVEKKENAKTVKTREKDKNKAIEIELENLLADLETGSASLEKIEAALRMLVMETEKIDTALRLAKRYEEEIVDSQNAQLLLAVAECKMAGLVKKTIDKVDWINTGTRHFEKIQRRWPDNENVYLYQTLTYSNFPSELGMLEQVMDLMDEITRYYAQGTWNVLEAPVDLLWDIWINLGTQYPKKTERTAIRNRAKAMSEILEGMKTSEKATEVLYE